MSSSTASLVTLLFAAASVVDASPTPFRRSLQSRNIHTKRSEPISFPINRRVHEDSLQKRDENTIEYIARKRSVALDRIYRRYYATEEELEKRAIAPQTIPMSSFQQDNMYYSTIHIGSPVQSLDVQLDTGSSDLWVPTGTCRNCNMSQIQPIFDNSQAAFLYNRSSTYQATEQEANVPYGDGSAVTGIVASDTVSIGSFTIENQVFIGAESEKGNFDVAGLIGLGWPSLASSKGTPWWLNALDKFTNPEMSFFFADWNSPSTVSIAPGGQFTLGGRNESMFDGEVQFVPLMSQDYWTIPLNSIFVPSTSGGNGKTLTPQGVEQSAIIDSGSTIITGPKDLVDEFYAAVDGAVQGETISKDLAGQWFVPCNTKVNAQFVFGNVTVPLPARVLRQVGDAVDDPSGNGQLCPGSLTSTGEETSYPAWIFGDSLLKGVYTVFRAGTATTLESAQSTTVVSGADGPAVGFAPLKGVRYSESTGEATLGTDGNGVDGRVGNAGADVAPVTGTGTGATNSLVTRSVSSNSRASTSTPTTTVNIPSAAEVATPRSAMVLGLILIVTSFGAMVL